MKEMEVCSGRKALFATENATSTIFFYFYRFFFLFIFFK